jgi:large subunit ribosomal protein L29
MAENQKSRARLAELRAAAPEDLDAVVANAHKSIYQFRKDRFSKPQENVKIVKNSRKEIARIKTIQRERELAERQK